LRLTGRGQAIPQGGYLGLDLVESLGQRLEGLAQFGRGHFVKGWGFGVIQTSKVNCSNLKSELLSVEK
jgi:hypothetical protein